MTQRSGDRSTTAGAGAGARDLGLPGSPPVETTGREILVDGFNVLHAVMLGEARAEGSADGWWRRAHRERLLERICDWRGGPDQIWVAFDGSQPRESVWAEPIENPPDGPESAPTVHAVFVESADDWIVRRARRTADPERTIVVSADRQVAGRARSAGCEIQTPRAFMSGCGPESETIADDSDATPNAIRKG